MDEMWSEQIASLLKIFGPSFFSETLQKFDGDPDDEEWLFEAVQLYAAMPTSLLVAAMFAMLFKVESPEVALSQMETGLAQAWRALIDERDTAGLSRRDIERDGELTAALERIRNMTDGLLEILKNYANGNDDPAQDANELILQAGRIAMSDLPEARLLSGRAGAAALRGARYWPLWDSELEQAPLAHWIGGLQALYQFVLDNDLYPLAPFAEQQARIATRPARAQAEPGPGTEATSPFERRLTPETQRLMDILLSGKEKLSHTQIKSLPPLTPDVVKHLIHILDSGEYELEDSPGQGWAAIHAAELLGQSRSPAAVPPLLRIAQENDYDAIVYSTALSALQELGEVALPVVLDSMRYSTDLEFKGSLAEPLGYIGKGDERAFRALEALYNETNWDDERMLAVMGLATLGDKRVVEIFKRALKSDRDIQPEGIREILGALEELEPEADPAQWAQLKELAMRRYDSRFVRFDSHGNAFCRDCGSLMRRGFLGEWDHVEPEQAARPTRPPLSIPLPSAAGFDPRFANVGRNDPCPCGSGKKFKHCHGAPKQTVH